MKNTTIERLRLSLLVDLLSPERRTLLRGFWYRPNRSSESRMGAYAPPFGAFLLLTISIGLLLAAYSTVHAIPSPEPSIPLVGDFTVAASPSSRTITQGQSTTYTITVTSQNAFSGQVQLFALNLPGNVVLAGTGFSPQTVNVPSGGSATSTFNYVSNNTVPTGTFTVTMQGQGGGLTRSTSVQLTINPAATPNFTVSASPSSRTITQGQSTTYTITVTSQNGFSGQVQLFALNLPGNIVLSGTGFSPQTVNVPSGGSATSTFNYVSNTSIPTGTFTVTMQGQGGGLTRNATVQLIINPGAVPDFTISASPSSRTITQGQSTTYTITVTSQNGFSGQVQLFALNLPGNIVLSGTGFTPQTVNVPSGGSATSTFNYVSNTSVPTGTFTVTMQGQGGGLTRNTTVQLIINPGAVPDFTISASPSSRTITQGQSTTYTITLTSQNGFSGQVQLFALNLPGNIVLSGTGFSPQTVNVPSGGSATSTFNYVSNSSVPTGTFTVTMQGQGGGLTRNATVQLIINPGAVPDFTISASPSSRTITQGQSTTYTITLTSQNGFSGQVQLFALNLPGNIVLSGTGFSPQTVNVPSGGSATSTFNYVSNSSVPTGTFTVTMQGQGGGLTRNATVQLIINPGAVPDFTISASPSSRTITQGQSTTYTITLNSQNGFSGQVQLFALNLPGNIVLSGTGFSPQTVNVPSGGSATSTFNYVSNTSVPTGTFTVTMQGQGGGLTRNTTVQLIINPGAVPDFTISASPSSRTMTQGQSTTYTITLTSQNGFSGQIQLFALNLPGNIVLSGTGFTPQNVNVPSGGSATSTFNYVSNTSVPTGTFTVTMQGQGAGLTRNATVQLIINPGAVPDFTISASPSSRTITQGQSTTYSITLTSQNGFSGSVALFALNLPGNVVLAGTGFSPQTVSVPSGGSATSTFNYVSNTSVPAGTFIVTMQGQGGGLTRSTTVQLIINPGAAPDFTISASPSSRTITQGQSTTYSIMLTSQNGFSGSVALFALNLPGNVVLTGTGFSPQTVSVPSGGSASSTFNYVSNNTVPTGTFSVTMQGQGGGLTRNATVQLIINPGASPDLTISAAPSSRTVAQGQSTTYSITLTSQNGFSGPVQLFALSLPANIVLSGTGFNPQTVNVPSGGSASSTFNYVSNNNVPTGTFTVVLQGQGSLTRSTTVQLIIAPAPPDAAVFVRETIPDNTPLSPGQTFTKTWTIRNTGATTWTSGYKLRWVGGDSLSNHADVAVVGSISPGSNYTFSIPMTAPASNGTYRENWEFLNSNGGTINVGTSPIIWVTIRVGSNCPAPGITTQPKGGSFASGASPTLSVTANNGQPPLKYQWYLGQRGDVSRIMPGAISSSITVSNVTASASYWVRVTSACGASVDSETASILVGQTLEIVDPACDSSTSCQGAYLQGAGSVGLTQNVDRLVEASVRRTGIVADGVTKLLVRLRSNDPVTLSLRPGVGELMQKDGSGAATEISVQPVTANGQKYVFAIYQAPASFVGSGRSLDVILSARSGSTEVTPETIKLERPPVLLVHGLHGQTENWDRLIPRLSAANFDVCDSCVVNYSADSAATINPNLFSPPIDALAAATRNTRDAYRLRGVAITQVDVVGHSMGGLVARARSVRSGYRRRDNYNVGDFRKLITIGTPHFGSPLAAQLNRVDPLCYLYAAFKDFLGPALPDLVPGSDALRAISNSSISTHAIVGLAPANSHLEAFVNRVIHWCISVNIDVGIIQQDLHDVIVPVSSQIGGLPTGARTLVPGVVHSDYTGQDVGELESDQVYSAVIGALNAPVDSNQFSPHSTSQEGDFAPLKQGDDSKSLLGTSLSVLNAVSDGSVLSPAEGTVVRAGETMTVSFTIPDGSGVSGAAFFIGDRIVSQEGSSTSFSVSYTVPLTRAGKLPLTAVTYGAGAVAYTASTFVIVEPGANPVSLEVSPKNITLERVGQTFQLSVAGQFADGVRINLSHGTAGTSYSLVSANSKVASVSTDGLVEALGVGEDTVLIRNSGATYTVNLTVGDSGKPRVASASISGKKLFISGEGFDDGAKILMDGNQQKTLIDEQNPATILIGKKAGKLIAPGQTVVLMVRNSDGSLSNGFSFTRRQ